MDTTEAREVLKQIGHMNVLAISGGRSRLDSDGVLVLPVGNGYSVEVEYDKGADAYNVRRVFARAGKRWVKGTASGVYCGEIGEVAYRASSFRSYEFGDGA